MMKHKLSPTSFASTLCVLCLLCGSISSLRADWTLTSSDLAEQKNLTVNTWNLSEGLSVTGSSGQLLKFDTRKILTLASDKTRAPDFSGAPFRLTLRNGDVLYGEPAAITGQSLSFSTPELGKILVPLKNVAALREAKAPADSAVAATDKDSIVLKSGDKLDGLLVNIDAARAQLSTNINDTATTDVDLKSIDRITFGGVTPARAIPPLSARLAFVSGTVLTVPLEQKSSAFNWTINSIEFKDPAGKDRKAAADTLTSIEIVGGQVVYLTELDPAKDEHTTFMGTQWPAQINKNVLGDPLKVDHKIYKRGIGVHTTSNLTYTLDGSFETFKFRVALDDSAAPNGAADVAISLDGKPLWQSKNLKPGHLSDEISLAITGGKKLELHATPPASSNHLDILGRVDWLNPILQRP